MGSATVEGRFVSAPGGKTLHQIMTLSLIHLELVKQHKFRCIIPVTLLLHRILISNDI